MRNNKPLPRLAAAICGLFLLCSFCSRSDIITGAGGSVVSDIDSTLTNLGRGFVQIALRENAVDAAFSLPNGADSVFSTQAAGGLVFGVSGEGDMAVAHIQYGVKSFKAEGVSALYSEGAHSDSLVGAYIYFLASDTLAEASEVSLFLSDTLPGLKPVNRADKQQICEDDGNGGCDGASDNRIGGKSFTLGGELDSIRLPDSIAERIFKVRLLDDDTSQTAAFAFSIVDYHGAMRKAHRPYVIVHVIKEEANGNKTPVRDSIPGGFARFTVFENSAMAEARSLKPYSSQLTKRTAVFRVKLKGTLSGGNPPVDYKGLIDSLAVLGLSNKNSVLLNAIAAIKHALPESPDSGSTPSQEGEMAVLPGLIGNYKALFLDTLITDEILLGLDSIALSGKRLLYNEFAPIPSTAPTTPYNTHSFKGALRDAMERYSNNTAVNPYIYIYLRPIAENSAILWEKPPKIETVFTPSRSQSQ